MTPICEWCGAYIEAGNRSHPGYCSATCRDHHHLDREHRAREARRARLDGPR